MPKQKLRDDRPIRQKLGVVAVGGDPHTSKLAAALAEAGAGTPDTEDAKAKAAALRKRIANHPIYSLLSRAATTGELPHSDELSALNVTQKYRTEIVAAARRIKREAESPVAADEERDASGRVRVAGYTHPTHAARSMAWDKAEDFIKALPSTHETRSETAARQADADTEGVVNRIMANIGRVPR